MSNIPRARDALYRALNLLAILRNGKCDDVLTDAGLEICNALDDMAREPAIRRAARQTIEIDRKTKARIKKLARDKSLTLHQIASATGVRSSGRVSEVLHGLR